MRCSIAPFMLLVLLVLLRATHAREAVLCEPREGGGHYTRIDTWGAHAVRVRVAVDAVAAETEHVVQALLPLAAVPAQRRSAGELTGVEEG
jgi:hypothetical protein